MVTVEQVHTNSFQSPSEKEALREIAANPWVCQEYKKQGGS